MANTGRFDSLRAALMLENEPGRVPLVEFDVEPGVMGAFLGRKIEGPADIVDFWATAGYGHVPLSVGLLEMGGVLSGEASLRKEDKYSLYSDEPVEMTWAAEHKGIITSMAELEAHPWPTPDQMDFTQLRQVAGLLPPDMKVVACLGKIFTSAWMLMGFETFCVATAEEPELVAALVEKTGSLQCLALEKAIEEEGVGAVLLADDIAYGTSTMVSPAVLRRYVFPWFKRMGELCRAKGLPFIYHSDGCLFEVIEDLVDCGFDALHPIEPQAMDQRKTKERVEGRMCLLGGVDVDRLARGAPEEIKDLSRQCMRDMGCDGAYALGSANSVPDYVPVENFRAMIEVVGE